MAVLRAEWVAYWRRLFRGGNAAKNNLFFMAVVALLAAAKYISFLEHASGWPVVYLLTVVFLAIAASLRNDGPLTAQALLRFPLTAIERIAVSIFSALVPPWSWIVMLFAAGIFKPLAKNGVMGIGAGVVVIIGGIGASQIPLPRFQLRPRSRKMTPLRKEIRYILSLPEQIFIGLITLAFCAYLIGGDNLQTDAFWAVMGIMSVLGGSAPLSAFSLDGAGGIDRFGVSPVSGQRIIRTKNLAFLAVIAAQRAPILVLAVWRMGTGAAFYGMLEAAALALLTLAWGNIVSVRHPSPPGAEPMILDGFVGFAASALPAAAAIIIVRGKSGVASLEMAGITAGCTLLWLWSLTYSGHYFTRNFDRIRALIAG